MRMRGDSVATPWRATNELSPTCRHPPRFLLPLPRPQRGCIE